MIEPALDQRIFTIQSYLLALNRHRGPGGVVLGQVVSVGLLAQLAAKAIGALTVVLPVIQGIHDSRQRESNLASGVAGASNSTG
jgi:hypothetical protein